MSHHGKTAIPKHESSQLRRAILACGEFIGYERGLDRYYEILALPTVEWKGRTLFTIRCNGETGKGPHDVNVPESLLWQLIHLGSWKCPYHT